MLAQRGTKCQGKGVFVRSYAAVFPGAEVLVVPGSKDQVLSSGSREIVQCLNSESGKLDDLNTLLSDRLFNQVVGVLRDSDKALAFYDWSTTRLRCSRFTLRTMVDALDKMNRHDESRKLFRLHKRGLFPSLMTRFSQQGNVEALLMLLKNAVESGDLPSVRELNRCMEALCEAGSLDGALKLLALAHKLSVNPDVFSYAIVVHALRSSRRTEDVYEVLRRVRRNKLNPDEVLSGARILGFVEHGEIDEALEVFHTLEQGDGLTPAFECYGSLVRALYQSQRFDDACEVATKAGCDPVLLNSLVRALLEKNLVDKARELVVLMAVKHGSSSVKALTCNNVLASLCKDPGGVKEAFELLEQMDGLGVQANKYTYSILISRLCRSMMVSQAKLLVELMIERGCAPDAANINPLVMQLCKERNISEALSIARVAEDKLCTSLATHNNLILGYFKTGRVRQAVSTLRRLLATGPMPNVFTYNIFIRGLCGMNRLTPACKLLASMNQEGVLPDSVTYNTLISGLIDAGELELALEMVREMTLRGCLPNVVTLTSLIKWYSRRSEAEPCMDILQAIVDRGLTPTTLTYNSVIRALCRAGRLDRAHRLFGSMVDSGCSPDGGTYRLLIHGLSVSGELGRAMVLLETMAKRGITPDVSCYSSIVTSLCGEGRVDDACAFLEQMPCAGDIVVFRTLVRTLCKLQLRLDPGVY